MLCKILHNLLSTAKNLGKWVKHFIQNMEEVSEYLKDTRTHTHTTHVDLFPSQIQEMTGDTNFGVVIVDFNSSDIDVKAELARSKLTQYAQHTVTSPLTSTLPHTPPGPLPTPAAVTVLLYYRTRVFTRPWHTTRVSCPLKTTTASCSQWTCTWTCPPTS